MQIRLEQERKEKKKQKEKVHGCSNPLISNQNIVKHISGENRDTNQLRNINTNIEKCNNYTCKLPLGFYISNTVKCKARLSAVKQV